MLGLFLYEISISCLFFHFYNNNQSKYSRGQFFKPHKDGLFISQNDDCSIFSVVVYLNDSGGVHNNIKCGGKLNFIDPSDQQKVTASFTPKKVFRCKF